MDYRSRLKNDIHGPELEARPGDVNNDIHGQELEACVE